MLYSLYRFYKSMPAPLFESVSHECVEMRLYGVRIMSSAGDGLVNVLNAVSCKYITVLLRECTNNRVVSTACDEEYVGLWAYISELHLALLHTAGVSHKHIASGSDSGSGTSTANISEEVRTHKSYIDSLASAH